VINTSKVCSSADGSIKMSALVFQVNIKQWDKSLRSDADVAVRNAAPSIYPIETAPEFLIFGHPCIIDLHSTNFNEFESSAGTGVNRPLTKTMLADGSIQLERFIIAKSSDRSLPLNISYQAEDQEILKVASLTTESGWIQASYSWRYRVEKNDQIFWQYEELILNMALLDQVDKDAFINLEPAVIFAG
jgi:hypothetical protein